MENASKALLMVGGILVGILILTLMATLFINSKQLSNAHNEERKTQAIQQFNVNFTKYLGQELTIHQVVTICSFAKEENNKHHEVTIISGTYTKDDIKININSKYKMKIKSYSEEGYIKSIFFEQM